jgi:hypothetical protein
MPRADRLPIWSMWVASFLGCSLLVATAPHTSCHAWGTCGADVSVPLIVGLFVGAPLAGYLNRTVAAGLAVLLAGYWTLGYVDAPSFGPAAYVLVLAYAGFGLRFRRVRGSDPAALPDPAFHAMVPGKAPNARGRWWLLASLAGLAGGTLATWGQTLMNEVDRRQDRTWVGLASLLLFGATIVGCLALGAAGRIAAHHRAVGQLFGHPQPVRPVTLAADEPGRVAVLDVVDRVTIPVRVEPDRRPASIGHARVYGDPVVGGWFATDIDGRLRMPLGPARRLTLLESLGATDLPERQPDLWEDEEDVEPPVPDRLLVGPDRAPAPAVLRTHREFVTGSWSFLAFALFLPAQLLRPLRHFSGPVVVGAVAVALAAVLEGAWRRGLVHIRFVWNDGGLVVSAGGRPPVRLAWSEVRAIDRDADGVTVSTDHGYYTMSGGRTRSRDQLWAALTDTWRRAHDLAGSTVEPPPVRPARRPLSLFALWLGTTGLISGFGFWVYSLPGGGT